MNERRKRTTRGCVGGDGFDDIDAASKQQYITGYCITMDWNEYSSTRIYCNEMQCNVNHMLQLGVMLIKS